MPSIRRQTYQALDNQSAYLQLLKAAIHQNGIFTSFTVELKHINSIGLDSLKEVDYLNGDGILSRLPNYQHVSASTSYAIPFFHRSRDWTDTHSLFQVVYFYCSREETKMFRVRLERFYVSSGIMMSPVVNCIARVGSYIHYAPDLSRQNRPRRTVQFQNKSFISRREIVCRQWPQAQLLTVFQRRL